MHKRLWADYREKIEVCTIPIPMALGTLGTRLCMRDESIKAILRHTIYLVIAEVKQITVLFRCPSNTGSLLTHLAAFTTSRHGGAPRNSKCLTGFDKTWSEH